MTRSPLLIDVPSGPDSSPGRARLTKAVVTNVVLLTMIAPLATDMYVPAFPLVGVPDLDAGATGVQLTLTTFFVGMALGQLLGNRSPPAWPPQAVVGRRIVVLIVASAVCALSPTIVLMLVARSVQGFSGGWAMVIARSVVVDLASGPPAWSAH